MSCAGNEAPLNNRDISLGEATYVLALQRPDPALSRRSTAQPLRQCEQRGHLLYGGRPATVVRNGELFMAIKYGPRSQSNINQLHGSLVRILYAFADSAPRSLDIIVTDGHRGETAQNKAFDEGKSKLRFPDSAHNKLPARAFDFCCAGTKDPYDRNEMLMRQGALRLVAFELDIDLKPLIDWDCPHVELA